MSQKTKITGFSTIIARQSGGCARRNITCWFGTAGIRGNLYPARQLILTFARYHPTQRNWRRSSLPKISRFIVRYRRAPCLRDEKGHIPIRFTQWNMAGIQRETTGPRAIVLRSSIQILPVSSLMEKTSLSWVADNPIRSGRSIFLRDWRAV